MFDHKLKYHYLKKEHQSMSAFEKRPLDGQGGRGFLGKAALISEG